MLSGGLCSGLWPVIGYRKEFSDVFLLAGLKADGDAGGPVVRWAVWRA